MTKNDKNDNQCQQMTKNDMMEDEEKGIVVHEVNNTVEFKGLSKVAKRNIPK